MSKSLAEILRQEGFSDNLIKVEPTIEVDLYNGFKFWIETYKENIMFSCHFSNIMLEYLQTDYEGIEKIHVFMVLLNMQDRGEFNGKDSSGLIEYGRGVLTGRKFDVFALLTVLRWAKKTGDELMEKMNERHGGCETVQDMIMLGEYEIW